MDSFAGKSIEVRSRPRYGHAHEEELVGMVAALSRKGVRLWAQDGALRYLAPRGALSGAELERLKRFKDELVALLPQDRASESEALEIASRGRLPKRAPLTFSQRQHWNNHKLGAQSSIRQVASALRVRGLLNVEALRRCVEAIVSQQSALRTRITVRGGVPQQEVLDSAAFDFRVHDVSRHSESVQQRELVRLIENFILDPVDVSTDALFGVLVVTPRSSEHVVLVALEHSISDGFSLSVLWRDLFKAYEQELRDGSVQLPRLSSQFVEYALQQQSAQGALLQKNMAYWNERLMGCDRLRFPDDPAAVASNLPGWETVSIHIDLELKARLYAWCRPRRTTLVLAVLTAYVATVLRWCRAPDGVFQYVIDGRTSAKVENTIGYFATALYLRAGLSEETTFLDLLTQVTAEYCRAYDHCDFSYLRSLKSVPAFTRNTTFNWLPRGSAEAGLSAATVHREGIRGEPHRFTHPMARHFQLDHEPSVLFVETEVDVIGEISYPANRLSAATMERFAGTLLRFIDSMVKDPQMRICGVD